MKKKILFFALGIITSLNIQQGNFLITDVWASETEAAAEASDKQYIESVLNLANNEEYTWSYNKESDAWTMSVVSAVAYPELPNQQGVSVCVPGAYVKGIDSDGDGKADITAQNYQDPVNGNLVIDYDAQCTSSNGQTYTAETAPVIFNTGAAGYGSSQNTEASSAYAADGYINVSCGNRGKQDTVTDEEGNESYTGDAPSCLVDQKAAARFVKYNILLGNLPGNADYFVSTGGSGGGAHAVMFAVTANNSDFYPYQEEAGAVGVYLNEDGSYTSTVTIDGQEVELSDGAWGCIAYSPITSLYEADMALAFEYNLDADYSFNTEFQAKLAEYLSEEYMDYINNQNLSVQEADVGFDLDGDGEMSSTIPLTIEYDEELYKETNGYGGTYLDLYLAEFTSNLQWYIDNLDYAEGWTWFDSEGNALSDEEVSNMTSEEKITAFLEGRYASSNGNRQDMRMGGFGRGGKLAEGELPDGMELPDKGMLPEGMKMPDGEEMPQGMERKRPDLENNETNQNVETAGDEMEVGTPDAGTTQASGSGIDSQNYESYEEMLAAYQADIAQIAEGDQYGNNIVSLYNPLNYIENEETKSPAWVRMVMGASEGDMSLFTSLNLQLAFLNAGVDCDLEWQWDGGHVPSEILSNSFSLYVDQMYGEYAGGTDIETPQAEVQTENGTQEEATGTDISSWVDSSDLENISFTLEDAVAYRTKGARKAMPGFDVIDYGQEDYVFGNATQDARHWDEILLKVFQEHEDVLKELFNQESE